MQCAGALSFGRQHYLQANYDSHPTNQIYQQSINATDDSDLGSFFDEMLPSALRFRRSKLQLIPGAPPRDDLLQRLTLLTTRRNSIVLSDYWWARVKHLVGKESRLVA